jgi:hypothetical protein
MGIDTGSLDEDMTQVIAGMRSEKKYIKVHDLI